MRTTRWRLGLIVPAGLVLLVGTLAALQYRWLGQVSDAERDAMRAALQHRATEFADEFDREITMSSSRAMPSCDNDVGSTWSAIEASSPR